MMKLYHSLMRSVQNTTFKLQTSLPNPIINIWAHVDHCELIRISNHIFPLMRPSVHNLCVFA